jgi:hypothetical protein
VEQCPVARGLKRKALNLAPKHEGDAYILLHGVLYWRAQGRMRVYAPECLRTELISEFHDIPIAGHLGWKKCYHAMAQHYYWPGMAESVRLYVVRCPACQRCKTTNQPRPPITQAWSPICFFFFFLHPYLHHHALSNRLLWIGLVDFERIVEGRMLYCIS